MTLQLKFRTEPQLWVTVDGKHIRVESDELSKTLRQIATTVIDVAHGGTGETDPATSLEALGGAPNDLDYVVTAASSKLSAEHVLTAGEGIDVSAVTGTVTVSGEGATRHFNVGLLGNA